MENENSSMLSEGKKWYELITEGIKTRNINELTPAVETLDENAA